MNVFESLWHSSRCPGDLWQTAEGRKRKGLYRGDPGGRASRLVACAWARHRLAALKQDFAGRGHALLAVEEAEAYALRPRSRRGPQPGRMARLSWLAQDAIDWHAGPWEGLRPELPADLAAVAVDALDAAVEASSCRVRLARLAAWNSPQEAALLRHVLACPWREEPLLEAPGRVARSLAWAAVEAREGGRLDPLRLAVLADCLEEEGYPDPELLAHLREPGPHPAGCWAVLSMLGL